MPKRVVAPKDVEVKSKAETIQVLTLLPLTADQARAYLTGKGDANPAFWTAWTTPTRGTS